MSADREKLFKELNKFPGFRAYRSYANFMLVKIPVEIKDSLKKYLTEKDIIVKFMNEDGLDRHIRITMGTHLQNRRLIMLINERKKQSMSWVIEYKNSLKMIEVEEVFDIIFYRPLAFLLVKLVYPTKITPNHLTLTAIALGITGGYFYSRGTDISCIYGAFFYLMFNVFDCSDGQLARLKKNGTPGGRLIDGIADYI